MKISHRKNGENRTKFYKEHREMNIAHNLNYFSTYKYHYLKNGQNVL